MFDLEEVEGLEEDFDYLSSGIYPATITSAYLEVKPEGALFLNMKFQLIGQEYTENFCIKSGNKKGNKVFFVKRGKKIRLPGFAQAYNICAIATGKSIDAVTNEAVEQDVVVWDFAKNEEVTKVFPVLESIIGKEVKLAIKEIVENRRAKQPDGSYAAINEEVIKNEIVESYFPDTMKTVRERKHGIDPAEHHVKFIKKWEGQQHNKYKQVAEPKKSETENDDSFFDSSETPF